MEDRWDREGDEKDGRYIAVELGTFTGTTNWSTLLNSWLLATGYWSIGSVVAVLAGYGRRMGCGLDG